MRRSAARGMGGLKARSQHRREDALAMTRREESTGTLSALQGRRRREQENWQSGGGEHWQ